MESRQLNILLIDDDEDDYIITRDLLSEIEGKQFKLDWISTYDDGLTEAKYNRHDVYLVDYRLGKRNGLEFLREAIQDACRGPFILLTGQGGREVDLKAMQAGAADYLSKNQVDAMILERTIRYVHEHHRLYEESQKQLQERIVLQAITTAGTNATTEDTLIEKATHIIGEAFQADSVGLLLLNEANEKLQAHASYRAPEKIKQQLKYIALGDGIIGKVALNGQPQRIINKANGVKPSEINLCSQLCVPLKLDRHIIGVINIECIQPNVFTKTDEHLLLTIAEQLATSIDRIRLFVATTEALIREQRLKEIAHTIGNGLDLSTILQDVVRLTVELIEAEAGVLSLLSANKKTISSWYIHNLPQHFAKKVREKGEGIAWQIVKTGQPVRLSNYSTHPNALPHWNDAGVHAFIGVPLMAGEKCLGTLGLFNLTPEKLFNKRDLTLAEAIGRQAGVAIQNAQLYAELQHRADALAVALAKQEELDKLKSEFIQNVSHELRTPLAIVYGYADLLNREELGELKPEQKKPISIITRRVHMLTRLVDDLISIVKVQEKKVNYEPIDLADLIQAQLLDFRMIAQQSGLKITTHVAPQLPQISGDILQLRQVLDNLFTNALKFTPSGGRIAVQLHQKQEMLVLKVADTGIGISPDQLDRIFDRFYQIDGSASRRYGGTGLGLALVKEIIEIHGGQVTVQSAIEQGSIFQITLPVNPQSFQD